MALPDGSANLIVPRIVPFQTALWDVAAQDGLVPEVDGLQIEVAHQLASHITRAYKYALDFYDWPEASIFTAVDVVQHPQWNTPFVPRVLADGYPATPNAYPIFDYGRLFGVWTTNPAADPDARLLSYRFGPDGLYLDEEIATVALHHRQSAPRFTATEWDSGRQYSKGQIVYHAATGHCYIANEAAVGQAPAPFQHAWRTLPLLACLLQPTIDGAYALYKRSEGQASTARLLQDAMTHLLEQEILQFSNQEQQTKYLRYS